MISFQRILPEVNFIKKRGLDRENTSFCLFTSVRVAQTLVLCVIRKGIYKIIFSLAG